MIREDGRRLRPPPATYVAPARPRTPRRLARRVLSTLQGRAHGFGAFGPEALILPPYRVVNARRIFIGARTMIGPYAFLSVVSEWAGERYDSSLRIGDGTSIGQNFVVNCAGGIVIGSKVLISSNVHIGDNIHRYDDPSRPVLEQPLTRDGFVHVGDGAFIGINAVVLRNVRIGRNAVIAAAAVVTKDVPDFCVAAGSPARIVKRYDFARGAWVPADSTTGDAPARAEAEHEAA